MGVIRAGDTAQGESDGRTEGGGRTCEHRLVGGHICIGRMHERRADSRTCGRAQAVRAGRVSLHRGEGGGRGHDHEAGCEYNDLGSKGQC